MSDASGWADAVPPARVRSARPPRRTLGPRDLWSRRYAVPAEPFEVEAEDGVRLRGHRLGGGTTAMVFCHGFLGWHRKPRLVRFQQELARWFTVYAFDLRGHGDSSGISAYGAIEHLDVEAAVRRARSDGFDRVVTLGGSMGGIAVIGHAARIGGVEAVVAISTPGTWTGHRSVPVRRLIWLVETRAGRRLVRAWGVRTPSSFDRPEDPADVAARVSPIPLIIVHGRDDHFFDEEQAWLLYRSARPPKRLLMASRFGHAEDGYSPSFADRVAKAVLEAVQPVATPLERAGARQ
jgi:pimeloyl-ACP methyl ester carboxylesterase